MPTLLTEEIVQTCRVDTLCLSLSPSKNYATFRANHPESQPASPLENYAFFMSSHQTT